MIQLDFRDSRPIFEQIKDKIKNLILKGAYHRDDKLMSVRELAVSLAINPNTILKSYKELEAEGYIYSVKGRGYFVSDKADAKKAADSETLMKSLEDLLRELCFLGCEKSKITDITDRIWRDRK